MDQDINQILSRSAGKISIESALACVPNWFNDLLSSPDSQIFIDTDESEQIQQSFTDIATSTIQNYETGIQELDQNCIYVQSLLEHDDYNHNNLQAISTKGFGYLWLILFNNESDNFTKQIDLISTILSNQYNCVHCDFSLKPISSRKQISDQYVSLIYQAANQNIQHINNNNAPLFNLAQQHIRLHNESLILAEEKFVLERELDEANSTIKFLKNSTIWKSTKPVRKILDRSRHYKLSAVNKTALSIEYCKNLYAWFRPEINAISKYNKKGFLNYLSENRQNFDKVFMLASPVDWNIPLFQRPQHLCRALAKSGFLVIYLTPNNWRDRIIGYHQTEPGLFITGDVSLLSELKDAYISFYSTASAYPPELIETARNNNNKIIYEYIDHIDPKISGHYVEALREIYEYIDSSTVDFVFASSMLLVQQINQKVDKEKILYVPNAVDADHYAQSLKSDLDPPDKIKSIIEQSKPVIGYFGAIAPWLWFELLEELAEKSPHYNFIFIGPDYFKSAADLPKGENFHYIGPIDYEELPNYARFFDVTLIPFAPGEISQTTSPLKLFEYFALEKPVVVTHDMHECTIFDEVLPAKNTEEYVEKLGMALKLSKDKNYKTQLQNLAQANTWLARAEKIRDLMD